MKPNLMTQEFDISSRISKSANRKSNHLDEKDQLTKSHIGFEAEVKLKSIQLQKELQRKTCESYSHAKVFKSS